MDERYVAAGYFASRQAARNVARLLTAAVGPARLTGFESAAPVAALERQAAAWLRPAEWLVTFLGSEAQARQALEIIGRSGEAVDSAMIAPEAGPRVPLDDLELTVRWDVTRRRLLTALRRDEHQAGDSFERSSTAERGIAEAVYADNALRISLIEHRYVLNGYIEQVDDFMRPRRWRRLPLVEQDGQQYPRIYPLAASVVGRFRDGLSVARLERWLDDTAASIELSTAELARLPATLGLSWLQELADIIQADRHYQVQLELGRLATRRLLGLPESGYEAFASHFAAMAPDIASALGAVVAESVRDEPVVQQLVVRLWGAPTGRNLMARLEYLQQDNTRRLDSFNRAVQNLRAFVRIDWPEVTERASLAARILARDPAGAYAAMDSVTRARYRARVSEFAWRLRRSESSVAQAAYDLAQAGSASYERHVGYYLIDDGLPQLCRRLGLALTGRERVASIIRRHAAIWLIVTFIALTLGLGLGGYWLFIGLGATPVIGLVLALCALGPLSQLAIELVAQSCARIMPPRRLPKLDFERGIPAEYTAAVVVPTMLRPGGEGLDAEIERLEMRFLANRESNLIYGLLTDFVDASVELSPEDEADRARAVAAIEGLADRYPQARFFLFHRPRQFNHHDQIWMGHERKRGKLEQFNDLIVNGVGVDCLAVGEVAWLRTVRFVITLDADTTLPPGAGRYLVEAAAHPLNAAQVDPQTRRVMRGYGTIQPRVSTGFESSRYSLLSRLLNVRPGVDPYQSVYSDLYYDLAGEAIYHGKGLYDPRVFVAVLGGRLPENRILSHDLLEGNYTRTALAADIELFDSFPGSFRGLLARQHRWIRGDWQVGAWAGRRVPGFDNRLTTSPLSLTSRFKHADNLRRSLVPVAAVAVMTAGLVTGNGAAAALVILVANALGLLTALAALPRSLDRMRAGSALDAVSAAALNLVFNLMVIPLQAWQATDAVVRAGWRLAVSGRRRLEWRTSDDVAAFGGGFGLALPGLVTAIAAATTCLTLADDWLSRSLLALWAVAPLVLARISRPVVASRHAVLDDAGRSYLRGVARQTWRFFDELMIAHHHFLPPDNIQVSLKHHVAPRTSPTNIGLGYLSWLSLYDLGFVTASQLYDRTSASLETLSRLETYRGHIYNWYDTVTLKPLEPRYVSMVDSGNLMASLWTFRQGLLGIAGDPVIGPDVGRGFLELITELSDRDAAVSGDLTDELIALAESAAKAQAPAAALTQLDALVTVIVARTPQLRAAARPQADYLVGRLVTQAKAWHGVLESYLGWYRLLAHAEPELIAALPEAWSAWCHRQLKACPTWQDLAAPAGLPALWDGQTAAHAWAVELMRMRQAAGARADRMTQRMAILAARAGELADRIDMAFLYDRNRRIFHIGYDVETRTLDASYYDLLASEARIGSFCAIAAGQVPAEHWWALGRNARRADEVPVLLSWSGTMFEYLMPRLFMREYDGSLLTQAYRNVVKLQRRYGDKLGIPWGISESAHSALDYSDTYQYRAFGVPALGIQHNLGGGVVVAPYASLLALGTDPVAAIANLERLEQTGARGEMGFFDAVDYRRPTSVIGGRGVGVYTYMSHHQGMGLVAVANVLDGDRFVSRFHRDLRVQAAESFLQEHATAPRPSRHDISLRHLEPLPPLVDRPEVRSTRSLPAPLPQGTLLTNGRLHTFIAADGSGYSRLGQIELGRWRADPLVVRGGTFAYIRDEISDAVWSPTYAPTYLADDTYRVTFAPEKGVWERVVEGVMTRQEVYVATDHDVEIRTLSLQLTAGRSRQLEITSLFEFGLAPHADHIAHPAFNKMFIEAEALPEQDGVIARRRPRSGDEAPLWAAHLLVNLTEPARRARTQTERGRLIGRDGNYVRPAGLGRHDDVPEYALDPVASVSQRVELEPGVAVELAALTIVADSREALLRLAGRYRQRRYVARARQTAWTARQAELQRLQIDADDGRIFNWLASFLLYPNSYLKAAGRGLVALAGPAAAVRPAVRQGGVLLLLDDASDLSFVRQLGVAQHYLAARGLSMPLSVYIKLTGAASQELALRVKADLEALRWIGAASQPLDAVVYSATELDTAGLAQLTAAARVIIDPADGSLAHQLSSVPALPAGLDRPLLLQAPSTFKPAGLDLELPNGYGGFIEAGSAYVIERTGGRPTPAPWANVMAGPRFGTLVSEGGSGFSWSGNSQSSRLSSFRNDPLDDRPSELLYVCDPQSGVVWSPQILPSSAAAQTTHRPGLTTLEGSFDGLDYCLEVFVPVAADVPVRVQRLTLTNTTPTARSLELTSASELVLGADREATAGLMTVGWDEAAEVLTAGRDGWGGVVFSAHSLPVADFTGDRAEFLGGPAAYPAGLAADTLSGRTGAGLEAMAVIRSRAKIAGGATLVLEVLFGNTDTSRAASRLAGRLRSPGATQKLLTQALTYWRDTSGAVTVSTPSRRPDIMLNHWLPYQILSGRIWGRTGYYQSSGAFGFRDQLQDALAMVYAHPEITRELILGAAAHQFGEGDAHHWWQPDTRWGLRTRMTDDRLWLAYATARYVSVTGDSAILDVQVPFLTGPELAAGQMDAYYEAGVSDETASLLEHCRRAIAITSHYGVRGLPLMGTGDWNDGYNLVGAGGRGESVWLGWFLVTVLDDTAAMLIACRREPALVTRYQTEAAELAARIEASAWDGAWYLRAFYDDGTPLGSRTGDEGRIDSLAQSWAVISGRADANRRRQALGSAIERLVEPTAGIVKVLAPAFDHGRRNPGYIKGYQPGIRENGGQYTHGSMWLPMALAREGRADEAVRLLELMNPIAHSDGPDVADRYALEPYVIAGDVYALPGYEGHGGWSWYTGSAGWMYRVWIEEILGLRVRGDQLDVVPVIPADWPGFELTYRFGKTVYQIVVSRAASDQMPIRRLDGRAIADGPLRMTDDGRRHCFEIELGA